MMQQCTNEEKMICIMPMLQLWGSDDYGKGKKKMKIIVDILKWIRCWFML